MKAGEIVSGIGRVVSKYKYALLVALCGVILMVFPFDGRTTHTSKPESEITFELDAVERRLEALLSSSEGVGRVKVMLTLERSEETVYMTEGTRNISEGGSDEKKEVSKVNGNDGEEALVQRTLSPVYRGAIILCDGAENDRVRLRVISAVSSLLGLGSDKIAVLPMNEK